jgi:hypothetical protein
MVKWIGLIGKGVKEKKNPARSVPCFCKRILNLHLLWWVVFRLKKVGMAPVKSEVWFLQGKTLVIHKPA